MNLLPEKEHLPVYVPISVFSGPETYLRHSARRDTDDIPQWSEEKERMVVLVLVIRSSHVCNVCSGTASNVVRPEPSDERIRVLQVWDSIPDVELEYDRQGTFV